jgi:transcriptional regulator with XRE-family HTH domain
MDNKIREYRQLEGLSQKELARQVPTPRGWLSAIENGHVNPRIGTVQRIAEILGVGIEVLFPKNGGGDAE